MVKLLTNRSEFFYDRNAGSVLRSALWVNHGIDPNDVQMERMMFIWTYRPSLRAMTVKQVANHFAYLLEHDYDWMVEEALAYEYSQRYRLTKFVKLLP